MSRNHCLRIYLEDAEKADNIEHFRLANLLSHAKSDLLLQILFQLNPTDCQSIEWEIVHVLVSIEFYSGYNIYAITMKVR